MLRTTIKPQIDRVRENAIWNRSQSIMSITWNYSAIIQKFKPKTIRSGTTNNFVILNQKYKWKASKWKYSFQRINQTFV